MELRQLRHLSALARHASFTMAALELGITQAALTRSVQAIEARAGVRLFDRDRGGVWLTEVGAAFVARANALLADAEELESLLARSADARAGQVRFGMAPLPAHVLLPQTLGACLGADNALRQIITIGEAASLTEGVASGALEFCVCAGLEPLPEGLRGRVLGRLPISLLGRAGARLLARPEDGRRLADFPLLASGPVPAQSAATGALDDLLGLPPRIIVNDFAILEKLLIESDAVWLASSYAVHDALKCGTLAVLHLPQKRAFKPFRMMMYSNARRSLSPAALDMERRFRARIAELGRATEG